jgi:hypothetical protein
MTENADQLPFVLLAKARISLQLKQPTPNVWHASLESSSQLQMWGVAQHVNQGPPT